MGNCNLCNFINITEEKQNEIKKTTGKIIDHKCSKFNKKVVHRNVPGFYIFPCEECKGKYFEVRENRIDISDLGSYDKVFKLEAQLINGTLIGRKDNKISCIAKIVEAKNVSGDMSKGIINIEGSCLWIPVDSFDDWIIKASEL